jgi:hypothetical protein
VFINFVKKQSEIVRETEDTQDVVDNQSESSLLERSGYRREQTLDDDDDDLLDFDQPGVSCVKLQQFLCCILC